MGRVLFVDNDRGARRVGRPAGGGRAARRVDLALTAFIELPGEPGGSTVMPAQNAAVPPGFRWHRRLRVHGWSNALFSHEGASATDEGRPLRPAADVQARLARTSLKGEFVLLIAPGDFTL